MGYKKLLYSFLLIALCVGTATPIISSYESDRNTTGKISVYTAQSNNACSSSSGTASPEVRAQIAIFIIEDISQGVISEGEISAEANLINDLGLTEQQVLDLIALCNNYWGINIPTDCFYYILTMHNFWRLVAFKI
ncbi:hypothetical protein LPTSP3_g38030 [Leptospira kobayashii]|uniref:Lipoprotein n=1 Tax=Leptospira kobayashii TaxID=1917830 RepID=A0ABM7UNY1_9LEPT|nr:hypothetical protein [Leptospira kobayashii]BDA80873.1 hypothetical protein LPTSP3_g38030 [Leptospira kobayashii]